MPDINTNQLRVNSRELIESLVQQNSEPLVAIERFFGSLRRSPALDAWVQEHGGFIVSSAHASVNHVRQWLRWVCDETTSSKMNQVHAWVLSIIEMVDDETYATYTDVDITGYFKTSWDKITLQHAAVLPDQSMAHWREMRTVHELAQKCNDTSAQDVLAYASIILSRAIDTSSDWYNASGVNVRRGILPGVRCCAAPPGFVMERLRRRAWSWVTLKAFENEAQRRRAAAHAGFMSPRTLTLKALDNHGSRMRPRLRSDGDAGTR